MEKYVGVVKSVQKKEFRFHSVYGNPKKISGIELTLKTQEGIKKCDLPECCSNFGELLIGEKVRYFYDETEMGFRWDSFKIAEYKIRVESGILKNKEVESSVHY